MIKYQFNDFVSHSILIPVDLGRKLGIKPGAYLSQNQVHELREQLGLARVWPFRTPTVTNRWLDNYDKEMTIKIAKD